jgi:hypothetical protein
LTRRGGADSAYNGNSILSREAAMTETHEFDRTGPLRREAGKGTFGCIVSLALIAAAVFVGAWKPT